MNSSIIFENCYFNWTSNNFTNSGTIENSNFGTIRREKPMTQRKNISDAEEYMKNHINAYEIKNGYLLTETSKNGTRVVKFLKK